MEWGVLMAAERCRAIRTMMRRNDEKYKKYDERRVSLSNACQSKAQNCLSPFDVMLCGM